MAVVCPRQSCSLPRPAASNSQHRSGAAAAAALPSVAQGRHTAPGHARKQPRGIGLLRKNDLHVAASAGSTAAVDAETVASSSREHDQLVEELAEFLKEDLCHLFDDQGIDASKYDERVVFEDPITRYDNIQGYLFNIRFLRDVFAPTFTLHGVRRTGPLELTTRWTMTMQLGPLRALWNPQLTFTGTSVMGINPETGKFNRHMDTWDAVDRQEYFSLEAFVHMLGQVFDLRQRPSSSEAAEYAVLLKRKQYEVRHYVSGPTSAAAARDGGSIAPGVYAAAAFGGVAGEQQARQAEQALRRALAADGLQPVGTGWLLAACDAGGVGGGSSSGSSLLPRRNEVLIPLQNFKLW